MDRRGFFLSILSAVAGYYVPKKRPAIEHTVILWPDRTIYEEYHDGELVKRGVRKWKWPLAREKVEKMIALARLRGDSVFYIDGSRRP